MWVVMLEKHINKYFFCILLVVLAIWNRVHFAILLLPVYFLLTMSFLNDLYEKRVLFPWQKRRDSEVKLFFSMDIFDLFWLILVPIPNAFFAQSYLLEVFPILSGWQEPVFSVLGTVSCAGAYLYVAFAAIRFASRRGSWTAQIKKYAPAADKYDALEGFNAQMFALEAVCAVWCILSGLFGSTQVPSTLAVHTLVASIILFIYWVMLVLSRIFNRMILGDPLKMEPLFSMLYRVLGAVAALAIAMSAYLVSTAAPEGSKLMDTYKSIIVSIIIPCIPIAIQVVQILSPKNRPSD